MRNPSTVSAQRIALQVGMQETSDTLKAWFHDHYRVVLPWAALSLAIACTMFLGVWMVATWMPQSTRSVLPLFVGQNNTFSDATWILAKNSMVLLLHLLVCVAAYLARRAVPMQAQHTTGINRFMHRHAGSVAMAAVAGLTAYSLSWQTWMLGNDLHSASQTLHLTPAGLLIRASLHGIPELTAVFLPLAACLILGKNKKWNQLLAATAVCAVIAFPILIITAAIEAWVTHGLF